MASERMQVFLDGIRGKPKKKTKGPIQNQRAEMDAFMSYLKVPDNLEIVDFTLAGRPARRYIPYGARTDADLLYLHGGGYSVGSLDSHKAFMACLALECDTTVSGLDYRLAPEHAYPAALDDAVAAFTEMAVAVASEKIMIAGDSAGGGLALATALRLKDEKLPMPGCVTLLSPATDLTCSAESLADVREEFMETVKPYAGEYPADTIGLSPLFGEMAGLPPMLIQVVSDEGLLDDSTRLAKRAVDAGVSVDIRLFEEAFHVFQIFTDLPESQDALSDIGRFYKLHIR